MAKEKRILIYFDELVMALTNTYGKTMDTHIYSPRDILSSIQGINRVDAEEVVRCNDCKHYEEQCPAYGYCYHWDYEQGMSPNSVDPDDFCSYGERREGE